MQISRLATEGDSFFRSTSNRFLKCRRETSLDVLQ
jgi:hypothetical protein